MTNIKQQILEYAKKNPGFNRTQLFNALDQEYTKGYLSQQLTGLVEEDKLARHGGGKYVVYALPEDALDIQSIWSRRYENKNFSDDEALKQCKAQTSFFNTLPENVVSIFEYAFTEMVNNAIDHSKTKYIDIEVNQADDNLAFSVRDHGVGVFNNIMQKKSLPSPTAAIQDLLKGKQTTQPKRHSGEGIFFTSKAADVFTLTSFGHQLIIDNRIDDVFVKETNKSLKGTRVDFQISIGSNRHLIDIFKAYQTDPESYDFDKTKVQIKLYTLGTIYVSRSQAKRVLHQLDKFKHIVLDFDQVPTIGQAFADEVFRVFAAMHKDIILEPINMQEPVEFMIKRTDVPANVKLES